nr:hypothetical protein BaRGS_027481 [Batillaria attramentaria]
MVELIERWTFNARVLDLVQKMAPSFLLSLVASSLLLAAVHVKADDPVAQDPAIQACSEACVDYRLPDLTPHDTGIWQGIWDNEEEEEK